MTFDEWFEKNSKDQMRSAFDAGFEEGFKAGENAKTKSVPSPITPPPFTDPYKDIHPTTWPGVKSCSKCGLKLEGVMGYVCNDMKCPTFKHTWSGTTTSGDTGPYSGGSSSAGAMGSVGSNIRHIVSDIKR